MPDLGSMLNNPAMMNMAQTLMNDPNIQVGNSNILKIDYTLESSKIQRVNFESTHNSENTLLLLWKIIYRKFENVYK